MSENGNKALTIGHSTPPLETFLTMLAKAGVTAVADVPKPPFRVAYLISAGSPDSAPH